MNDILVQTIARALPCDAKKLTFDSGFSRTRNWDSLGHVRVMSAIEQEFGLELTPQTIEALLTIKDIEAFVFGSKEH